MRIVEYSANNSFSSLKASYNLKQKLNHGKVSKMLLKELNNATSIIKGNALHKKKYVDIILNQDEYSGKMYAVISSKKQGVPMNPYYKHNIPDKKDKVGLKDLIEWVSSWDYLYSPEGLEEKQNIENSLITLLKKFIAK